MKTYDDGVADAVNGIRTAICKIRNEANRKYEAGQRRYGLLADGLDSAIDVVDLWAAENLLDKSEPQPELTWEDWPVGRTAKVKHEDEDFKRLALRIASDGAAVVGHVGWWDDRAFRSSPFTILSIDQAERGE